MKIVLVAAIGENNVIGRDGQLPWRLKSDLKNFRKLTINKPVIMGRKTYVAIGKPLNHRTNIVLTSDLGLVAPGAVLATSLDAALSYARRDAERRGVDEIMIIGGSDIFAAMMPQADRLEITHVHAAPEGDAFFPPFDLKIWREVARTKYPAGPDDEADFTVVTYLRQTE
jgi:dihydrofolate reductase